MSVNSEHSEALDEGEERIENLKQEKAKDKSAFTRVKKKMLYLLDEEDSPSRREVKQVGSVLVYRFTRTDTKDPTMLNS